MARISDFLYNIKRFFLVESASVHKCRFSLVLFVITRNEVMKFITAFIVTLKLKDYRQGHQPVDDLKLPWKKEPDKTQEREQK